MEHKDNGNGHKIEVFDTDGTKLPSIEVEKALNLVKTFSAKVKDGKDNAIVLSEEIQDELGFQVQRGWRDDHITTAQPFPIFPTDKKRMYPVPPDLLCFGCQEPAAFAHRLWV